MIALPAVFDRRPWGLVAVHGPDATSFLQSLVSQDLDPVGDGETVPSLLLHPQGKLDVSFRATRRSDEWWLDTDPEFAPRLAAALMRFRIRVKVEIDDRTAEFALASVVGASDVALPDGAVAIPTVWGERVGVDVLGPAAAVAVDGYRHGDAAELEVLRIDAGIPRLGVDIDDTTIPQEAFLERDAVSFTKGCFVGQELVCRIDSRGHVNRFLRRLDIDGSVAPVPGADVASGDKVVGLVTSAAVVPDEDRVVALAMLRREVEPLATVQVAVADHAADARVRA
jgi:folate-binding protein YgfZ